MAPAVMTTAPLPIAVVIPCHNARHRFWRSVASVTAQTLQPAQILVVGHESADGLAEITSVNGV